MGRRPVPRHRYPGRDRRQAVPTRAGRGAQHPNSTDAPGTHPGDDRSGGPGHSRAQRPPRRRWSTLMPFAELDRVALVVRNLDEVAAALKQVFEIVLAVRDAPELGLKA